MKRSLKTIVALTAAAATTLSSLPTASACGGRSGGGYARYSRPSAVYSSAPAISYAPRYAAPVSHGPAVTYNQSIPRQTVYNTQPIAGRPAPVQAPVQQASVQQASVQQTRAQQIQQQPVQQAAAQPTARPATQQVSKPVTQATAQAQATPAAQTPAVNVQDSALAALASLTANNDASVNATASSGVPTFSPAPAAKPTQPFVGTWRSMLPSKVAITLSLTNDGNFTWAVTDASGKTSQFSGQYRMDNGRLILVRSKDLQQMAGALSSKDNGFTFKLDGSNNGGLQFDRA